MATIWPPRTRRRKTTIIIGGTIALVLAIIAASWLWSFSPDRAPNGETARAGGQPSGSPSATKSASPPAKRFTTPPNVCLYLSEHPRVMAPLVPGAKLWIAHKATSSCIWDTAKTPMMGR